MIIKGKWVDDEQAYDESRYGYARGWSHLHAAADQLSLLVHREKLDTDEHDRIHWHLVEVHEALYRLFSINDDDDEESADTYSDGSPVFSVAHPAPGRFPRDARYLGDLGWANYLPPGAEVIVEKPPHLRDSMADER